MIHHATEYRPLGDHYAVSKSTWPVKMKLPAHVLVQLSEQGEQVRIPLTVEEARHMAQLLLMFADEVEEHIKIQNG